MRNKHRFFQLPLWNVEKEAPEKPETPDKNGEDQPPHAPDKKNNPQEAENGETSQKKPSQKDISDKLKKLKNNVEKKISIEDRIKQINYITNLNYNLSGQKFIGKEKEINRCIQILCRKKKRNPLIIGESGTGKSHMVEEIARLINIGNVPAALKYVNILLLDTGEIIAGTKFRGEFEARLKNLLNLIEEANRERIKYILFIDDVQYIMGLGSAEGSLDGGSILKPKLTGSTVQCVGTTTPGDYRRSFRRDPALSRRFTTVYIEEPTYKETIDILIGIKDEFEKYYNITIDDNVIENIISLSHRHIKDKFFPDKAIDILDESCSRLIIRGHENKNENVYDHQRTEKQCLTNDIVNLVVSEIANIPISETTSSEKKKLSKLKETLSQKVIAQEKAIEIVSSSIQRSRVGLKDEEKPIGVFLFVGQSGTGKTLLAKTLSDAIFGSDKIIRLDMSEYMEKHSVSKIIGSPPGYIGYDESSCFVEQIRKRPYSVVLLDEIEKAHGDVLNILLQIFDEGRLTDSMGRLIDFRNIIIIMTSNIAASKIIDNKRLGFQSSVEFDEKQNIEAILNEEIKKTFRPEFINKIDEIVYFNKLSKEDIYKIFDLEFGKIKAKMHSQKYFVKIDKSAKEYICQKGYSDKFGARPIVRSIKKYIEVVFAEKILNEEINPGSVVYIKHVGDEDGLKFFIREKTKKGNQNGKSSSVSRIG